MTMPPAAPQPAPYAPPGPQPPTQKSNNGLGLAALIVGIVAIVGAFIPFVNYVSGFLALVGLVLGIIALCLKNKKKGTATAGTVISGLAMILSIVMALVYTAAFASAVSDSIDESLQENIESAAPEEFVEEDAPAEEEAATGDVVVVYEVTGESQDASITYSTYNDGSYGTEQANGTALPFSKEITVKAGGDFDWSSYTLIAMNGYEDEGDITCSITVDGEVVSEQTSSGSFATATCSMSSFGND